MKTGRVALLHIAVVVGAVDRNRSMVEAGVKHAAAAGAQWIITPELSICGLQFARVIGTDWIESQPDAWMAGLCRLAKTLNVTVCLGCPEREGRKLYNSAFLINSRGQIVGRHRKINVASDSLSWSSPGETVDPLECDGLKVGILVCADAYESSISGALKSRGAKILLSPTSWGPGLHGPNGEWEERTRETGLSLIVCNRTGAEKTLDFWTAPSLVVQDGKRLLSHTSDKSAILFFDWNFTTMRPLSTAYKTSYYRQ